MRDDRRFSDVEIEDPGKIHYHNDARDIDAVARLDLLVIREAWNRGMDVEDLADGFAVASEIDPETGEERTVAGGLGTNGDWSGIRDSSKGAKEKMLAGVSYWLKYPNILWGGVTAGGFAPQPFVRLTSPTRQGLSSGLPSRASCQRHSLTSAPPQNLVGT